MSVSHDLHSKVEGKSSKNSTNPNVSSKYLINEHRFCCTKVAVRTDYPWIIFSAKI